MPSAHALSQLKAHIEHVLDVFGIQPCNFAIYVGLPSMKIDAGDDTSLFKLGISNEVITVRSA